MRAILRRAAELAREGLIEWAPAKNAPPLQGGTAFSGTSLADGARWSFFVLSFGIEDQGFAPGSLGYDGTLTYGTTIVHLPRDLAQTLHTAATASTETTK